MEFKECCYDDKDIFIFKLGVEDILKLGLVVELVFIRFRFNF